MESPGRLWPRPSAGVSSCVAPVQFLGLDAVAREELAGVEGDDGDRGLVDDRGPPPARVRRADLEVVHPAAAAEGDRTLLVGDVVAQAEVAECAAARRVGLGLRAVRLARRPA